jgi:hypothetical protein
MYFISAAVILLASLALIVQVSLSYNNNGRASVLYNFILVQDNETLFPNWQKELWQTFEETSGYVRPERVNTWPNSMIDR